MIRNADCAEIADEGLERLADALNCEPAHLLNVDPSKGDAMWSLWEQASEGQRRQIEDLARVIVKKSA